MTKRTQALWSKRVREWRASGLPPDEFAVGKGYAGSSLRWADSYLRRGERAVEAPSGAPEAPDSPREARPRAAATSPRFVPLRACPRGTESEVVVEVGSARIRVATGLDLALLADVVRALGGGAR